MTNLISRFIRNDSGAAAVEYGLLVALIAAVIVVAVAALGPQVQKGFCEVSKALQDAGLGSMGSDCPA